MNDLGPTKPKVIGNLLFVGDAVFILLAACGVVLGFLQMQCIEYCDKSYATYGYEENPEMIFFAGTLIIGGWIQKVFIHGFSVGLEQLFEIRKNTSK